MSPNYTAAALGRTFIPNPAERNSFRRIADKFIESQYTRVLRGEIAKMTWQNHRYRARNFFIRKFGDQDINKITHDDLIKIIDELTERQLGPIAISQYLQTLKGIFNYAYAADLLLRPPVFPTIRKSSVPRGAFTLDEYRLLLQTAKHLTHIRDDEHIVTHRESAGGIFTVRRSIPKEIPWLIGFMVNGFMRPSDVIHIQHRHVTIVRSEHIYLRLSLPETKRHRAQIVTLQPAVRIYEHLREYMSQRGLAGPDDYLFLPEIRRREAAGPLMSSHFKKVLEVSGLRYGSLGQARTLYSLRHTAIMFRLLYGRGIDLLTLARNARTSVQMIEKFYASNLTAEMNIGLLQSHRSR